MTPLSRIPAIFPLLLMLLFSVPALAEHDDVSPFSPLRLSYVEGEVSFWRYGAEDWVEARVNTPLAAGDELYVGRESNLELQMGSRAFIRAGDDTQLALVNQSADFAQFKVTNGRVSFDLRTLPAGYAVEVNTPNAVFTIEHSGYYRVDVDDDEVHFITRRGGRATMVPAGGRAMSILPSEEVVIRGTRVARAETYVAPELDGWDRWNYDRTGALIEAASERYLPSDVAGAYDLDYYGRWRVVPQYGTVWVPTTVIPGWAPYSTGRWVWDPYYQWTWIDDAPWGWAPYHYGRWVYVSGYWAWAPGPVVRHAVYAPALVVFYGSGTRVSVTFGSSLCWVALSWGEPLVPWWGSHRYVGRAWWGGWGGPRVVNNVVVNNTTIVNVTNITYVNTRVSNAIVATPRERFGKGYVNTAPVRVTDLKKQNFAPIRGALPVKPEAISLAPSERKGIRPPDNILSRPVVATRAPHEAKVPWRTEAAKPVGKDTPEKRFVIVPKQRAENAARPEFGAQTGEERALPPQQQRFKDRQQREVERVERGGQVREREPGTSRFGAAPLESERTDTRQLEREPPRLTPSQIMPPPRSAREEAAERPMREQQRERVQPEMRQERIAPPQQSDKIRAEPPQVDRGKPEPQADKIRPEPQADRMKAEPPSDRMRPAPREERAPTIAPPSAGRESPRGQMPREEAEKIRPEPQMDKARPVPQAERSRPEPQADRMRMEPPSDRMRPAPREERAPTAAPPGARQESPRGQVPREEVEKLPGTSANRVYRGPDKARGQGRDEAREEPPGQGR